MTDTTNAVYVPLTEIDGQSINIAAMGDLINKAIARLQAGLGFTIFTLNMDHVVKRRVDATFREAYARATFVTADGAPVVWLARRQRVNIERTTGADMLMPLCEAAAAARLPVALFGASERSLRLTAAALKRAYPSIQIVHFEAPAQQFDPCSAAADAAAERIARSGARLCFVALGAPKQEMFSDRMAQRHSSIGFLGIGAALDFISGEQTRAPAFLQNCGLEWAWRLGRNPVRLAGRYYRCAVTLAALTLLEPMQRRVAGIFAARISERS